MRRSTFILSILFSLTMVACGDGFRSRNQAESSFDQNNYTGGVNRSGIPFTGFGKMGEMDKIRQLLKDDQQDNQHIAKYIRWIELKNESNLISVNIRFEKPGKTETAKVFKISAPLNSKKGDWIEISTKKDFVRSPEKIIDSVGIECINFGCESAYLVFKDSAGQVLTGALVKTEKKHVARSQAKINSDQSTKDMSAFVKSLQVVNGGSYFEAQIPAQNDYPATTVSGEVVETNGDCHEVRITNNSSKACLVGNTQEGEIVLMIEPKSASDKTGAFFIDLDNSSSALQYANAERLGSSPSSTSGVRIPPKVLGTEAVQRPITDALPAHRPTGGVVPRTSPTPLKMLPSHTPAPGSPAADPTLIGPSLPPAIEECPFVLEKEVPMLMEYFGDCNRQEIKDKIETWWKKPGNVVEMGKFMELYQVAFLSADALKKTKLNQRQKDFRTMIGIIIEKGFHHLTSVISFIESGFNGDATSNVGAAGFWQIMPETATSLGLTLEPEDQRRQIKASTRAAIKHLDSLLTDYDLWEGNFKLAMAAYNWGQGNLIRNQLRLHGVTKQTTKEERDATISQLTMRDVVAYSSDFWKLYEKRMMPVETRKYVINILSASSILLAPGAFGFDGQAVPQ